MKKRENNTLQGFLIRNFVLILVFVAAAEAMITYLMNKYYFPVMRSWFFQGYDVDTILNKREIVWFLVIFLLQLVVGAVRGMMSAEAQAVCDSILDWLNDVSLQTLPEEIFTYMGLSAGRGKTILFFLFLLVAVIFLLFPYVAAAIAYAKIVMEEVQALEEKRDAQKKEFDQKRNRLISDIAHDLRTPVTTIYGYSKALLDGMIQDDARKREYLLAIQKKSERVSDLTNLLFEYVKLDSDGFSLEKEELDLAELLRENVALVFPDIEDAGMEAVVDIPDDACMILADKMQLSRVFSNLLVNAIRHNDAGTTIDISLKLQAGMILVAVADTGESIPDELKDQLFDLFAKGDMSRKNGKGSGLGLAIADKIVQMHGWQLYLEQPYKGLAKAFVIMIPYNYSGQEKVELQEP